jgi:hypothetical protein
LFPNIGPVPVCIRVGRPVPHPKGAWACPVQAEELRLWQGPSEICGEDSWQAPTLGLRFLQLMLAQEVERGAVLHWEDGEHAISIEELFVLHKFA